MSFIKRSRIVSLRVTQDEYENLERISREYGANSVSEFLRQLIFASVNSRKASEVSGELDELRREVHQLSQIVRQGHQLDANRTSVSNDDEPEQGLSAKSRVTGQGSLA